MSEDFGELYRAAKPHLDAALFEYTKQVQQLTAGVPEHYVTGRVKTARSLVRKMRDGGRSWDSISDKVGLRVICTTRSDCRRVDKILSGGTLEVVSREVKKGRHDQLYYPGIHLEIRNADVTDHRGEAIVCEVQIRTRAQDAWSVASHKLVYKGLVRPPKRMLRLIDRLTILVEVFDDEVVRLFKRRRRLPRYREAVVLEYLDDRYHGLTGEVAELSKDLAIANLLFRAYTQEERPDIENLVDGFCDEHPELADLIAAHSPVSQRYNDNSDWLFTQPEVLMVLERGSARPHLLLDAVSRSDLEDVVRSSCSAAGIQLPTDV